MRAIGFACVLITLIVQPAGTALGAGAVELAWGLGAGADEQAATKMAIARTRMILFTAFPPSSGRCLIGTQRKYVTLHLSSIQ